MCVLSFLVSHFLPAIEYHYFFSALFETDLLFLSSLFFLQHVIFRYSKCFLFRESCFVDKSMAFHRQVDSMSTSFIPEFLSTTDSITDMSNEEYSFIFEGKREIYYHKSIKNYYDILQVLGKDSLLRMMPMIRSKWFSCIPPFHRWNLYIWRWSV